MTPSNIISDKVYICGQCGSSAVTASALTGGQGTCRVCQWEGPVSDLLVVPIEHTLGGPEQIKAAFHGELKELFGKRYATPLLRFLVRWGYLSGTVPDLTSRAGKVYAQLVGRYITAVARAAGNAILETREEIEKELRGGPRADA